MNMDIFEKPAHSIQCIPGTVCKSGACVPVCPSPGTNLITNPGFENGFSPWSQQIYGANNAPSSWGIISGGDNSNNAYSVSSSAAGTGTILSQSVSGLVPGVSYTFSYNLLWTNTPASSISCYLSGLNSESITSSGPVNTWVTGPTNFGGSFTATASSGTFECYFIARGGVQTWDVDNFFIGC